MRKPFFAFLLVFAIIQTSAFAAPPQTLDCSYSQERHEQFKTIVNKLMGGTYDSIRSAAISALEQRQAKNPDISRNNLSDDELVAIRGYTNYLDRTINPALVAGGDKQRVVQPLIDTLSCALLRLPDYDGNVHTGTKLKDEKLAELRPGFVDTVPRFRSSSKYDLFSRRPHQLVMKSKHGKYIAPYSMYPHEEEVLFFPQTKFLITDRIDYPPVFARIAMEEID